VSAAAILSMVLMMVPVAVVGWPMRGIALVTQQPGTGSGGPMGVAFAIQGVGLLLLASAAIASLASLVLRWRRARGIERAQLKWLAFAVSVEIPVLFVFGVDVFRIDPRLGTIAAIVATPLIPIAIGIAILRYRLFEIDRIISRTLSYAVVTITLAIVFVGAVLGLQAILAPVTGGKPVAVAASTLIAAALFQPLRRRVKSAVDRRFNRARYDAQRTADAFAARLRDQVDLEGLSGDLQAVVGRTLEPSTTVVWVRSRGAKS
jgi:hypothetical protein